MVSMRPLAPAAKTVQKVTGSTMIGGYFTGLPLLTSMIDIHEVGTGGGSIASSVITLTMPCMPIRIAVSSKRSASQAS